MKDKEIDGLQQQLRAFTNVLAMGGVTNDSNKSGSSGGGGGNGGLGAVGRSLGVNLNGVNGDSGSGSGLGGLGYTPSTLSLDLPIATELSSFNGRRGDGKEGSSAGAVSGKANGRNGSGGGSGGANGGGLGLVNLEDQLTQMVTGVDASVVNSVFTSSAFGRGGSSNE